MSYLYNLTTYQDVPTRPDDDDTTGLEEVLLVKYYDEEHIRLTITMTYDLIDGEKIVEMIEFVTEHKEKFFDKSRNKKGYRWINRDAKESLSGALIDCFHQWEIECLIDEQISIWGEIKKGGNL